MIRLHFRHLGPVSKLLRRRHHATYLATKSCDNIYSVNRSSSSLDWRVNQTANEKGGREMEYFSVRYDRICTVIVDVTRAALEIIIFRPSISSKQ